jgi:hypothetical protein
LRVLSEAGIDSAKGRAMKRKTAILGLLASVLAGFVPAAPAGDAPSWGDRDDQYVVTAWDMQPNNSTVTWQNDGNGYRFRTGGSGTFMGAAHLPQGALIGQIAMEACDHSVEGQVEFALHRLDYQGSTLLAIASTGVAETPGCAFVIVSLPVPETVEGATYRYLVVGGNDTADGQTTFGAVRIEYHLQVSPAPTFSDFNDVPTTDPAFQFIQALYYSGITAGCGGGNYCPDAPLTRRQMAVFLSKALGLYWPNGLVN